MDIRQLKLELIHRISRCQDEAILRAVASVLAIEAEEIEEEPEYAPPGSGLPLIRPAQPTRPLDDETQELQRDIDEVFSGG